MFMSINALLNSCIQIETTNTGEDILHLRYYTIKSLSALDWPYACVRVI